MVVTIILAAVLGASASLLTWHLVALAYRKNERAEAHLPDDLLELWKEH